MRTNVGGLTTYAWLPARPRIVLVARTPYGAAGHAPEGAAWAAHGVGLVVQDVRGRHESPGTFHPYTEDHHEDGPALLAWVRSRWDAPVVLLGTSYGAHAALATAAVDEPDGVVAMVPALGLGETARTRGGVLQLASRLGWWLAHAVTTPWHDVVTAQRRDAERAAAVGTLSCPLLAIGGTADHFAHDTVDLWAAWGGPSWLVMGPWDHALRGSRRARRVLDWLDAVLAGSPPNGVETVDQCGNSSDRPPAHAVVHVDAAPTTQWCASLTAGGREVAHGAARGSVVTLGPVLTTTCRSSALDLRLGAEDFPRYARSPHPHTPVPRHHLELIA
ncbi:CocE/NonD family hydrolase [Nocardioides plantarum]|uniref:CocE/NonD family hydrolase n=1 Tax=Nocardioides plantarum TaxID=29299 RepID=A0ABV5K6B9_9ACTN|nr:CocE/NonD family hydrolase [Nocardioides plantarum]